MSVSTETETSENEQQNEEQEAAAQTEEQGTKVLIIHTDIHRFFPLDDTETRLNHFDEYQLYEFGKPLDTDEENNSDVYQSSEE